MATKLFEGESTDSIEDAIKKAIASDPKGEATDIFRYKVSEIGCDFGGIAQNFTYKVRLERVTIKQP